MRRPYLLVAVPVGLWAVAMIPIAFTVGGSNRRYLLAASLALVWFAFLGGYAVARRKTTDRRAEVNRAIGRVATRCPVCDTSLARSEFLVHLAALHPEIARYARVTRRVSAASYVATLGVGIVTPPLVEGGLIPDAFLGVFLWVFVGGVLIWTAGMFVVGALLLPNLEEKARRAWKKMHENG
jgi:hypothetical protein